MATTHADKPVGTCPACNSVLRLRDIRLGQFNCPQCSKALRPVLTGARRWLRVIVPVGTGFAYAWTHGWNDSFIIFVVSLYIVPAMLVWGSLEINFFPPRKFEPVGSP